MSAGQEFRVETAGGSLEAFRFIPEMPVRVPAIIVIHGARSCAEDIAGLARQFAADGIEAITYSMAGYGRSVRKGAVDDSDRRHAEDLVDFTRCLKMECVLNGTSRGAGIGLIAAALGARTIGVISTGGALDWSGIRDTTPDTEIKTWLQGWSAEELHCNSAAHYLYDINVPVRLEYGETEDAEVRRQNGAAARALRNRGVPVEVAQVAGAGHAYLDRKFPEAWRDRIAWMQALLS